MPGASKKLARNDRRREEGEAPNGKKLSEHGIEVTCGFCKSEGHNKGSCHHNPNRNKKAKAFLVKKRKKLREAD